MKRIRKNKHLNPTHGWSNGMRALPALLFLILNSSFFICSCSDDTLSGITTDTSEVTVSGTGVRFGVNNATRLTASGYTRTFDEGDLVGCVVCTLATTTADDGTATYSYEMLANSKWAVDGTYNTLRPIDYWAKGSSGSLEKTSIGSNNDLLFDYDDSGNTIINYVDGLYDASDGALYFFYYTPFVEPDETSTTALDSVPRDTTFNYTYTQSTDDSGNLTISKTGTATAGNYMMGPATDNSLTYSGASSLTAYDWQTFPLYVHRDQRTDAHSAASAWMTEQYTQGLYPGSSADVSLTFEPLTADLLVTAEEDLAWAALVPLESTTTSDEESGTESSSETSTAAITLGKQADLKTGDLTEWTQTDAGAGTTTDTIWGHADGTDWLFHLAPQDDFSARLLFKYKDSETLDDGYARYMDLTDFTGTSGTTTGVLSAGAQYDVTVPSRYEIYTQYLYFTAASTPSSNYVESTSGFFTVGTRGELSTSCTTLGTNLVKSGIVDDVSEFTYAIKFQNQSSKGEYVGFEVPSSVGALTLAVYLEYQTSTPKLRIVQLPTEFDFSSDVAASNDQTYNGTTYTATTYTASETTDDEGNEIHLVKTTLEAGYKYMIYYGGNTSYSPLIVLTNDATINL